MIAGDYSNLTCVEKLWPLLQVATTVSLISHLKDITLKHAYHTFE